MRTKKLSILRKLSGIIILVLVAYVLAFTFNIMPVKSESGTIIVPDDFSSIQQAINAANLGDTVIVKQGIYDEKIFVNKSIRLIGQGNCTVYLLLDVSANYAKVANFIIGGDRYNPFAGCGGILRVNASRVWIENITIGDGNGRFNSFEVSSASYCNFTNIRNADRFPAGAFIENSDNNVFQQNEFYGLIVENSDNNRFINNVISYVGLNPIRLNSSSNNVFYHNNFYCVPEILEGSINQWDNEYPSGGNFWKYYSGGDLYSGPFQNVTGSDGIGDAPQIIGSGNVDRYPLMAPFNSFEVGVWDGENRNIEIISNSTISDFKLNTIEKTLSFNVIGENGTVGFCRITIPAVIMENMWMNNYTVLVDGKRVETREWKDIKDIYIFFAYNYSQHKITILQTYTTTLQIETSIKGITDPSPGLYFHFVGELVSVSATPDLNYRLAYWVLDGINVGSQNPIEILMDSNHTLQAVFTQIIYELSIIATAGGTTNPLPGTYTYVKGAQVNAVTVTAIPSIGFSFNYWLLDDVKRTENPITVIIDSDHTLEAYFVDDIPPDISEPIKQPLSDEVEPYQEVHVWVNVTDYGTGIKYVTLWHSLDNGITWTIANMKACREIHETLWEGTIPGYKNGTWVIYKIIAFDNAGNQATKDGNGCCYQYHVIPEHLLTPILLTLMMTITLSSAVLKRTCLKYRIL